jgi:hypothetical protein
LFSFFWLRFSPLSFSLFSSLMDLWWYDVHGFTTFFHDQFLFVIGHDLFKLTNYNTETRFPNASHTIITQILDDFSR